jgi:uncharacterized coiled-coil DUF342 family protein
MENIHKIRQNRENNAGTVTEEKRIIGNEIRELREKINNHLDKLQEDLLNELTNLCIRYDFQRYKFCNRGTHVPYSITETFHCARCRTL